MNGNVHRTRNKLSKVPETCKTRNCFEKGATGRGPVGFQFDGTYFLGWKSQSGYFSEHRRKHKNVRDGNTLVSLTVDDLESVDPWKPRFVRVDGVAEVEDHNGIFGHGKYLKITPTVSGVLA